LEYHKKSLYIVEKCVGKNDSRTAINYNNIGLTYKNQGKYNEALEYCKKSYEIRKINLGEDHADTISTVKNIELIEYEGKSNCSIY
jgi:tetratricopeptide (TPR) repeat protein